MATSRTGTAKYKAWRKQVIRTARINNITHCPIKTCRVELDYSNSKRPNSAEADHITPWANGGRETPDNGQVLCRRCNQSLGDKKPKQPTTKRTAPTINFAWPPTNTQGEGTP